MARIFLSYSRKDADFAHSLTDNLRKNEHEIIIDVENLIAGQDWRSNLSEGLKSADVFIILLSESSITSHFVMMELGAARNYVSHVGKPLIIPILIDEIPIPSFVQDIFVLKAKGRNIDDIILQIERAISVAFAVNAAREKKEEEIARKIENNAATYVEDAIKSQKLYERKNNRNGIAWYVIGFLALLSGIAFTLISLFLRPPGQEWLTLITILLTNIIVVGFLGACSRYAFSLGKAYVSESLKASDRIHAIAFGQFYLRAFGEKASWAELKEVFQHWNIDRSSTFSNLDTAQIDPQILALISQIMTSAEKLKEAKK